MSFAMTEQQVLAQTKDITRRLGWRMLKPGDLVQPVRKSMGLKRGEKIVKLGPPIRIVSVRREPLEKMFDYPGYGFDECRREGFGDEAGMKGTPAGFIAMFRLANGCGSDTIITRIEFAYT